MLTRLIDYIIKLFSNKTYSLAIVRRYTDANGAYVGELYLLGTFCGVLGYNQIGMSLDTLPFDCSLGVAQFKLDTKGDFLQPMPENTVRVGAQDPRDTPAVREHVGRLSRRAKIQLIIQNRFVEHVLSKSAKEH